MNQHLFDRVDAYLCGLLSPDDEALANALRRAQAAGLPAIQVAPNQGKLLMLLARAVRARRILEVGTLGGYSAIWLARGLEPGGRLVTLEIDPAHARAARESLTAAGLRNAVEVIEGPAAVSLERLAKEHTPPFDLTFIDADKKSTPAYAQWAIRLSRPGSIIVIDNVVRGGETANPDTADEGAAGVRTALDALSRDPRVECTAIQTVGSKGHDGLAIAVVRAG